MRVCDIYWITLITKENFYAKSDRLRVPALDDAVGLGSQVLLSPFFHNFSLNLSIFAFKR